VLEEEHAAARRLVAVRRCGSHASFVSTAASAPLHP
jgi:hypothetical protein